MDDWTKELDSGGKIDIIYTNVAKVFDTVPHSRLLLKFNVDLERWVSNFFVQQETMCNFARGAVILV